MEKHQINPYPERNFMTWNKMMVEVKNKQALELEHRKS